MKPSIDAILKSNPQLTSLPEIVYKLNDMVTNPRTTASDFAEVVIQDTALTARLLKIVNSPFYNFPNEVNTISMAITIIGVRALRDLVITTAVVDKYSNIPTELINPGKFWRHSVCTGLAAKTIGVSIKMLNTEQLFVMGVLHDIGRLLLAITEPDKTRHVLDRINNSQESVESAEFIIFGFDHSALGGELAKNWGLPQCLYDPIMHHHAPTRSEKFMQESAVLHVANEIAYAIEHGLEYNPRQNFDRTVLELLHISADYFTELVESVSGELDSVLEVLHITDKAA